MKMEADPKFLYLTIHGDKETGTPDVTFSINTGISFHDFSDMEKESRKSVKETLCKAYENIHNMSVTGVFGDECPTCSRLLPSANGPTFVNGCPERWHSKERVKNED